MPPDILIAARNFLAAVVFFKSTGRGARIAVALARGSADFREFKIDDKNVGYFAAFTADQDDVSRLLALMLHAVRWAGTTLFIRGKPTRWTYLVERTLTCFCRSFDHDDPCAYCKKVSNRHRTPTSFSILIRLPDDLPPTAPEPKQLVVLPCKHLFMDSIGRNAEVTGLRNAVQSSAIENDLDWCPRFDIESLSETLQGC
jgi:hypothetical protein